MTLVKKLAFVGLMGASALAFSVTGAAARIVCNADGDCWHAHADYDYAPSFGLTIHPDDWHWKEGEKHAWREHEGRGYWKSGAWVEF
jgi:hypothetical protein